VFLLLGFEAVDEDEELLLLELEGLQVRSLKLSFKDVAYLTLDLAPKHAIGVLVAAQADIAAAERW
jgi:hypothetical protein